MSEWTYTREEATFTHKTGIQRCVIVDVEEKVSQSGKNMIVVTVTPSGSKAKIRSYIVEGPYFNRNMTDLYDAFPSIPEGNMTFLTWIGAEGAAYFCDDDRNPQYQKVKYFVKPDKAASLPPFEGEKPTQQEVTSLNTSFNEVAEDDMPF